MLNYLSTMCRKGCAWSGLITLAICVLLAGGVMACDEVPFKEDITDLATGLRITRTGTMKGFTATPVPDTTTHYIARIDTTGGYIIIPPDTILCEHGTVIATTPPIPSRYLDSIYFGHTEYVIVGATYDTTWAPLVTVKLRPDQVEELRRILHIHSAHFADSMAAVVWGEW